jgi:hypothetical protein
MAGPAEAARELRRRVEAAPGQTLEMPRDEVVELLAPAQRNGDDPLETARFVQALLRLHGLRARPALTGSGAVRTTLRIDRQLAVQGALAVAVVAVLAGFYGRPLYGVLLAVGAAIGVAAVAYRFAWLDERLPQGVPRGRTLGALTTLVPVLLIFLAVVLPIRQGRINDGDPARAAQLVAQARAAIEHGDIGAAQQNVTAAATADPGNPIVDEARGEVIAGRVQKLLDEQNRKEGVFDEAERAFDRGDVRGAIRLMSSIRGFRNADQRLAAYRRAARSARG